MTENRKLIKRTDLILICAIAIAALILLTAYSMFYDGTGSICEISYEGTVEKTVDLSVNSVFSIDKRPAVVFEVKDGMIAFIESDCPDKSCVNSGFLSHNGQLAACLPNMLSIRVLSKSNKLSPDEPDLIAY